MPAKMPSWNSRMTGSPSGSGQKVICSHTIVLGHGRVVREKEHFTGLLDESIRCNLRSRTTTQPLFRMVEPDGEHRPLLVYDAFADGV
jgi:hypothetical protein